MVFFTRPWVRVTSLERLLLVLVAISSPSRQADLLSIRPENFVILIINGLQNCEIKNLFASFLRTTLWLSSPKLKELSFQFPRLLFFLEVRVHTATFPLDLNVITTYHFYTAYVFRVEKHTN